jgi:hypothetical protein
MIHSFLDKLMNDPEHSAPWTDIDHRNDFYPKQLKAFSGFKIMHDTLQMYPELQSWIRTTRPPIIHIIRKNFLKQHISQLRLQRDKLDHTNHVQINYAPIKIDLDQFFYRLNQRDEIISQNRDHYGALCPYFELYYEDFFSSFEKSKSDLLSFLGTKNEAMPLPELKKISSNNIRKEIANWQETVTRLKDTQYHYFLNDFSEPTPTATA